MSVWVVSPHCKRQLYFISHFIYCRPNVKADIFMGIKLLFIYDLKWFCMDLNSCLEIIIFKTKYQMYILLEINFDDKC